MPVRKFSDHPLFSVVLPTHNRPAMLARAVASVLDQSLRDFELIIVDDGSTVIQPTRLLKDPRIRFVTNMKGCGVARSRNVGIRMARGRFISFIDDDDEYLSSFLASTYARLKDTPWSIAGSWCGVRFMNYFRNAEGRLSVSEKNKAFQVSDGREGLVRQFLSIGASFGFTIKARSMQEVGGFDERLRVASDTDLFLRILMKDLFPVVVPGVHVVHHNHLGGRLTHNNWHAERIRTCEEWLLVQYSEVLDRYPGVRRDLVEQVEYLKKNQRSVIEQADTSYVSKAWGKMHSGMQKAKRLLRKPLADVKS